MTFKQLFKIEAKPHRGLLPLEWVTMGYLVFTLLVVLFTFTKVVNPESMIWGRLRIAAITVALWGVYRIMPCPFTRVVRITTQLALLGWWYPDTYEINRMFPNLDHIFASWEQTLFSGQPSLWFCRALPWPWFSELMDLGYVSYYPLILLVVVYYLFWREKEYERAATVVLTGFFAYYLIYIFLPVAGPTFYFEAIGLDKAAQGVFPAVGDWFNTHTACLSAPGYHDGVFYQMVEAAKAAGERPTAAFPSSHVGITTILMLLALRTRRRPLIIVMAVLYTLLCFSTVYIQAHYAIDALAGLATGILFYFILMAIFKKA